MAKIFRTEELSVNGDNIRLTATQDGNLVFKNKNNEVVASTDDYHSDISSLAAEEQALDSHVSSLQAQRVSDVNDLDSDVSSLQAQRGEDVEAIDSDISSLQAQRGEDVEALDSDVSSLQAQSVSDVDDLDSDISSLQAQSVSDVDDLDSDVSSLHDGIVKLESKQQLTRIEEVDLLTTDESKTVTFNNPFETGVVPAVVGILKAGANDPIIAVQLTSASNTEATFVFSDDIPGNGEPNDATDYKLVVMASN